MELLLLMVVVVMMKLVSVEMVEEEGKGAWSGV